MSREHFPYVDGVDEAIAEVSPNKRSRSTHTVSTTASSARTARKKKSPIWDHFDDTEKDEIVKCKYCDRHIRYLSKNGTSAMKNHIDRCPRFPANLDRKQKLIDVEEKVVIGEDGIAQTVCVPKLWQFNNESARKSLARMVIVDEMSFRSVEREVFHQFCKELNPEFVVPSRSTLTRDCYALYIEQRRSLKGFLNSLSSRVSLTTDTWTSAQNMNYMCLTAHFIDSEWRLRKKIINFCHIVGHSGELIGRGVEKCLLEWGFKRILTITVDNASSNKTTIQYLSRRINHWGGGLLNCAHLHMRCAAHILNLVVKDGLKDLDACIVRVRAAVRFVRSSPARLLLFKASIEEENIEHGGLVCLDVDTRWNSTYLMLESALKFKKAFDNMYSKGGIYVSELRKHGGAPCDDDWVKVACLLPFLKIFYNATLNLSGTQYVTTNFYVLQIFGVGDLISDYCKSDDAAMRSMAHMMKAKFDKYWGDVDSLNVLLFVALALDPRHKMNMVEFIVNESFPGEKGTTFLKLIKSTLRSMFNAFEGSSTHQKRKAVADGSNVTCSEAHSSQSGVGESERVIDVQERLKMKYKLKMGQPDTHEMKDELDRYLSDQCEPDYYSFDILTWWRDHQKPYPTLSKIARDVLAIPVSTVASESAFSTGGRVLDSFRTSLTPRMVEALVCAQDWMRTSDTPLIVEENMVELEAAEDGMKNLTVEQPLLEIDESYSILDDE